MITQRTFLSDLSTGLSNIALLSLLSDNGVLANTESRIKKAQQPLNQPKAKRVLMIFCSGACSHIDTFDYKPDLIKYNGHPMPGAEGLKTFQGEQGNLTQSPWAFKPRGQSGKMISDLIPKIAEHADDMCFIHSLHSKTNTHGPGENFMSTGNILEGYPSVGAWVSWALGSENHNLPAYVAIPDPRGTPQSSVNNWSSGFLPSSFQGTDFNSSKPLRNLHTPTSISHFSDKVTKGYLEKINRIHQSKFEGESELEARIQSYSLAARMQLSIPRATDLSKEPASILKIYGADDPSQKLKSDYAKNCILARKLLEEGVRFVQLFNGAYQTGGEGVSNWDGHKHLFQQYSKHGPVLDQPTAALISDLKTRGLLEDTLVVWCTEFGRMPTFQKGASGRDHNPDGFSAVLLGAGVKAPFSYGATDSFGYKAVENPVSVYDLHASILAILGLDHEKLAFLHNGFERKLTDVHGHIIRDILS